jgi:phosphatidylglycerophosphatase A
MNEKSDKLNPLDWLSIVWSTWFGSGLLPVMPGTWGTVAAIPLVVLMSIFLMPQFYVIAVLILFLVSIPLASRTAHLYRTHPALVRFNPHARRVFDSDGLQRFIKNSEGQKKDPGMIVIDEVIGYAVAMIAVPPLITTFAIAFILFRFFDIVKIEPGRMLERIGGGTGIILDDVAAGAYACILIHAFLWIWGAAKLPLLP